MQRNFKFQKSDKRTVTLNEGLNTFSIVSRSVLPKMRNVSENVLEKIEAHISYSIPFFQKRAFCEIMRKIILQPVRPQTTI
jgi:hypothetical protein